MKKIATHDSATGEKGLWYCLPLVPFAKTQSKTIKEQYEAGCRSFDIRLKHHFGAWRCAHGLWFTKRTAMDILNEINEFPEKCQVCLTYEGTSNNVPDFTHFIGILKTTFTNIIYGSSAIKYGKEGMKKFKIKYEILDAPQDGYEGGVQGFLPLDGRSWHTFLPIPWLWDKLYKRPHQFNEEKFTYVDFL